MFCVCVRKKKKNKEEGEEMFRLDLDDGAVIESV